MYSYFLTAKELITRKLKEVSIEAHQTREDVSAQAHQARDLVDSLLSLTFTID